MTRDLIARFAPVFDAVGADAVARERERRQPYPEVAALRDSGFTRITLPAEHGGADATHEELFELLAELARRDSNLAQLLRSHFSLIDRLLHAAPSARRDAVLAQLGTGLIHGNATFERSSAAAGHHATSVTRDEAGLRLDGVKYYSTGTLFADLVSVAAERDGEHVSVLLRTDAPGVSRLDDWDGFGQRLTGSGTTRFENVRLREEDVLGREPERPSHGGAFVQLVLLAAAVGIGRAVVDDAARWVRERTRTYSHATASLPREDPIVQEAVGELSALSFAADAALHRAVAALSASSAAIRDGQSTDEQLRLVVAADAAAANAQLVILPSVLKAATGLFEVGGASATDGRLALDRHWRNARTIASHNPVRYKARALGDLLVNGTPVAGWWWSGESS